jgi:hypothetical protein
MIEEEMNESGRVWVVVGNNRRERECRGRTDGIKRATTG